MEKKKQKKVKNDTRELDDVKRPDIQDIPPELIEEHRDIFNIAPFGFIETDLKGNVISCSDAFCQISGFSRQEFIGKHFTQLPTLRLKDMPRFTKIFQNFVLGKFHRPIEFSWLHKDGSTRLAEVYASPLKIDKNLVGIQALVQDITVTRKAEEELKKSEMRFRSIVESSPMGIHMYELRANNKLIFTGANSAADRILGVDNSQFIGKTIEEAFPSLSKTQVPKRYKLAAKKGIAWKTEQIDYQDDKIKGAFEVFAFQTSPGRMAAFFLDITDRKKMELSLEQERRILDRIAHTSPAGILVTDKKGNITFANRRTEEILGLSRNMITARAYNDRKWRITGYDGKPVPEKKLPFSLVKEKGQPVYGVKLAVKPKTGKLTYLSINEAPLFDREGSFDGTVSVIEDVSEKIMHDLALAESEEKYRDIVELSPDAIALIDTKGVVTDCNSALVRLTGASKEELIHKHFTKLSGLLKKDIPKYMKIFSSLLRGRIPEPLEVKYKQKDGQLKDGELLISLMKKEGKLNGVQVIARDITEKKRARDQLKFRLEFESLVLKISTEMINITSDALDKAIHGILKEIGHFSEIDRSYVFLYSADGTTMDNTHEWCAQGITSQIERLKGLSTAYFSWSLKQIDKGEPIHIPVIEDLPPEARHEKEEFKKEGIKSVICVPLLLGGKAIGFIGFDSVQREKVWSADSIMLLRLVADMLSNAFARLEREKKLKVSEEKFRTLAENSPNMIFININGRTVFANEECTKITGLSQEEMLSPDFNYLSLVAPESHKTVEANFARHMNGEKVPPYEYTLVTKSGRTLKMLNSSKLISYGGERAILGVVTDITAQKKAEAVRSIMYRITESAREMERLDELFSEIHSCIADVMPAKKNFYIALIDEALDQMTFPYFVDEFENNPGPQKLGRGLTEYVFRNGQPLLANAEVFKNLETRGEVVSIGPPSVDWLGVPLKVKNKTIGVMAAQTYTEGTRIVEEDKDLLMLFSEPVARAIERKRADDSIKESERKYRELYEGSRDASAAVDLNGRYIEFNPPFQEMLGYAPGEIYRLTYEDITPSKWHAIEKKVIDSQVRRRGYSDFYEKECIRKDGSVFPVELRTYLSKNAEGSPVGMWAIVRDITERKRIEKEILTTQESLRNLTAHLQSVREQERINVAREIHDEMGQTLTALKMDLAWINRRLSNLPKLIADKISSMFGLIDVAVQSMKRIMTELRPGLLDDFGLSAAMEWHAEEFSSRTGIDCRMYIRPNDIELDKERSTAIFRIFQEALTNIALHSAASTVNVKLIKRKSDLDLIIQDDGQGISKEKILSPKSFGIMGMRERVNFMQGEIKFEGEKGRGTTITARIPL